MRRFDFIRLVSVTIIIPLLVCHFAEGGSTILSFENLPPLNEDFCFFGGGASNTKTYNYFLSALMTNVSFDPAKGWSLWVRENCNPNTNPLDCQGSAYNLEGVRYFAANSIKPDTESMCTFCPYHLDPIVAFEDTLSTQAGWSEPHPMYGPCLDGLAPKRMVCLQHHALRPPKFVGKYHYPKQKALSKEVLGEYETMIGAFPIHQFLADTATASPYKYDSQNIQQISSPSDYGLGKKAVEFWLNNLEFQFPNGTADTVTTALIRRDFTQVNKVEQWMKYSQYFCEPGCHKYDRKSVFKVRLQDIRDDAELSYLSFYLKNNEDNKLFACRPCPTYFASYHWDNNVGGAIHPRLNILAEQCYPWFGAIPSMIPLETYYMMNTTSRLTSEIDGKIDEPETDYEVHPIVCPINTFNRVCAHTKESIYNNAMATNNAQMLKQYECTPCPAGGYHTGGKTGQWYCLPPAGRLFDHREWLKKEPRAWGDRDYMALYNYPELECGPFEEDCKQCEEYNQPKGTTPEVFNEKLIFERLLSETICDIGFYCPDPYSKIACPAERPWSPEGSGFLTNCTCAAGKYLNRTTSLCVPCTSSCQHLPGFYLPASQCMLKNGATADAPCLRCNNLPSARAVADGAGMELRTGVGACPYHCIFGSELDRSSGAGTTGLQVSLAERIFACSVPSARKKSNQRLVYNPSLQPGVHVDRITFSPATQSSKEIWSLALAFSDSLEKINTPGQGWMEQPTSCLGGAACTVSQICYAENQPASLLVDATIPWYSFASMVNCTRCPQLADLPAGSYLMSSGNILPGSSICQSPPIFCNSSFYFDPASWSCQSCAERQSVVCPPNTRLRAAGCMNRFAAFNRTVPSADCQFCPLDVPDFNVSRGRFYLNYQNESSSAVGGCSMDACPSLRSEFFWSQQCGADSAGQQSRCRQSCHLYEFREAMCSATADLQCRNCTLRKAGFQMTDSCTLTSDSLWSVCQAGFFCDESGEVARCPVNRTSLPGARSVMDCFCMAGMQESSTGGTCEPFQCEGTVMSSTLPGISLVSLHYMTINPLTKSTICLPCNTNGQSSALAHTRGSGVHVTSCVCPSGFYGVYANSSRLSIECTPCPSTFTCFASRNLPLSCAEGDIKLMPRDQFPCACAVAPFTNPSSSCVSAFSCIVDFQPQLVPRALRGLPRVSGSSGHSVNRKPFRSPGAWNRLLPSSPNTVSSVQAFAISGLMDETFLGNSAATQNAVQSFHYEYVFWIVEAINIPVMYTAILDPTNDADTVDVPYNNILPLQLGGVNPFVTLPKAIGIATSKWRLVSEALPYTEGNRIPWLFVGLLFRKSNHGLFYLSVRVFNVTGSSITNVGVWEPTVYNMSLFPSDYNGLPEAIPVAMGYGTQVIGETAGAPPGYFYIAFNSVAESANRTEQCGGVIMKEITANPSNAAVIMDSFCTDTSERITGMVVSLAADTKAHYILLALSSGMVFKISSLTNPRIPDTSLIPSISGGASELHNLGLAFSVGSLMYITGVSSETLCENGQHCFRVADSQQMSWVELQGLPWGSSSNPWPMSMGVSLTSRSEAILVVSSGPSLFTISFNRCLSPDEYWDGAACMKHSCIKQTPCNAAMIRNEAGNCVCRNGFWAAVGGATTSCQICREPKFCEGGVERECPERTQTRIDGASSVNDCVCPTNGQFFAQSLLSQTTRCTFCQAGDTWCPNRWLSLSCPGNKKTLLTQPAAVSFASPIHCQCAAGYTGPGCIVCPDGFYCPDTGKTLATNLAVYYTLAQTPLTDKVLTDIRNYFSSYFQVPATRPVNYNPKAMDLILYTQAVPISNRTSFGIMVMIQVEGSAIQFSGWPSALQDYLLQRKVNVTGREPSGLSNNNVYSMQVPVNKPLQCMVSKVPDPSAVFCICAPGYESRGEQCSACPVNTFKANSGTGSCVSCPLGRIAPVKATACILDPSSSSSSTAQNAGGPDVGLLIGGIGGGVVGLIVVIFAMQYFFKQSK